MVCRITITFVFITSILFSPLPLWSCTTFNLIGNDYNLVGKNYDWPIGNGMLLINKRGLYKTAMRASNNEDDLKGNPATWISKYGSVTFNQYGRELPTGGINEAGLVVESMALRSTVYPTPDSRPFIHRSQWKQYQLDNYRTVNEVIKSDSEIRIIPTHKSGTAIHYFISDRTGRCAIIEFIDGKMVTYTTSQMPVRALANDTYAESIELWEKNKDITYSNRFIIAARHLGTFKHQNMDTSIMKAFSILVDLSQQGYTKWNIVYDINNLTVSYRTESNPGIHILELQKVDFSCGTPIQALDINEINGRDVIKHFTPYSLLKNSNLIMKSFRETYNDAFNTSSFQKLLGRIAKYPDTINCQ